MTKAQNSYILFLLILAISMKVFAGNTVYFFCDQGNYWKRKPLIDTIESCGPKVKAAGKLANLKDVRYIICYEMPMGQKRHLSKYPKEKLILVTWEPPAVLAYNFDAKNHALFGKVFTWHDTLVDDKKFHKINYMVSRPMIAHTIPFAQKKFCCLINKNINRTYPTQLISQRMDTINFFNNHAPQHCDLYGSGWHRYKKMNRGKITGTNWRITKIEKLKKYKFNLCYENCAEPGYITEKIFDAFHAGVIPIYLGAPNIEQYIPKECFIDKRDFNSNKELYTFLQTIDETTYNAYIENIRNYLLSDLAKQFTVDSYIKKIVSTLFS